MTEEWLSEIGPPGDVEILRDDVLRDDLDSVQFKPEITDIEARCNNFAIEGKRKLDRALIHCIRYLQYQKERVEKGEIAAGTLRNSVKSLKAFCDSADLNIPWK